MTDIDTPGTPAPLETFFAGFAAVGFTYHPTASAQKNFARLCKASGWVGNSSARTHARQGFKDALVQQFNFLYGVNGNDLAAWHHLCDAIDIQPVPDTVEECRKVGYLTLNALRVLSESTARVGCTCQYRRSH